MHQFQKALFFLPLFLAFQTAHADPPVIQATPSCERQLELDSDICQKAKDLCNDNFPAVVPNPIPVGQDDKFFNCKDRNGNPLQPTKSKQELCDYAYKNCILGVQKKRDNCIDERKRRVRPLQPNPNDDLPLGPRDGGR